MIVGSVAAISRAGERRLDAHVLRRAARVDLALREHQCARNYSTAALDVPRAPALRPPAQLLRSVRGPAACPPPLRARLRYVGRRHKASPRQSINRLQCCPDAGRPSAAAIVADLSARPQLRLARRSILGDRENMTTVRAERQWFNEHNSREIKIAI